MAGGTLSISRCCRKAVCFAQRHSDYVDSCAGKLEQHMQDKQLKGVTFGLVNCNTGC